MENLQKEFMEKRKQVNLDVSQIIANPLNDFAMEDIAELKNSLMTYGLLEPLGVIGPLDDGTYMLLSGERRLNALNSLFEEQKIEPFQIPVFILGDKDMDEVQQKLIIKTSNLETRENMDRNRHKAEIMELLKKQVESDDITAKMAAEKAAAFFKTSDRYARYWRMVFFNGDEEIKDMVKNNQIDIKSASALVSMKDEEKREAYIEKAKNGENVRRLLEQEKQTKKEESKANPSPAPAAPDPVSSGLDHLDGKENIPEPLVPPAPSSDPSGQDEAYPISFPEHLMDVEDPEEEDINLIEDGFETDQFEEEDIKAPEEYRPEPTALEDMDPMEFLASRTNKNGRIVCSEEELERMAEKMTDYDLLNNLDDIDINLDGIDCHDAEKISSLMKDDEEEAEERYLGKLNAIMAWCQKMKNTTNPSEAEWDVIYACKEVVDRFL